MRKTNKIKKSLNLNTETVRTMQEQELANAAGGIANSNYQPRTCFYTCTPQTPNCPR